MPRSWHSSLIIVVVFCLGLAAGIAGMVWAWPGVRARMHHHESFIQTLTRTLALTPAQAQQVKAVLDADGDQRHQIHVQFQPQYAKICEEFMQVSGQEHDAVHPVQQAALAKLQTIMTAAQWSKFAQERTQASKNSPPRHPGVCRPVGPPPGASSSSGQAGPGPGGGHGGHHGPGPAHDNPF